MNRAAIWMAVSSQAQATPDKVSLPEQRKACEQYAADNDMRVVETLVVEGESRALADLLLGREKLPAAYTRLAEIWESQSIDVLICYEPSRLGRSQSLYTTVVENCVNNGIDVHVVTGGVGVINRDNFRGQIAIGGFATTSHMDSFRNKIRAARERMAALGLPVSGVVPFTHKLIRDDKGKIERVVVDPQMRTFLDDLGRLLIDRVAWARLPDELAALGHYHNGDIYNHVTLYRTVHTPVFWGNQALGYRTPTSVPGLWVFDPAIDTPDDVMIWYDTELTEPAYTGELADAIQDELRRRTSSAARARGDSGIRTFTGLIICRRCVGAVNMRGKQAGYRTYYGCKNAGYGDCDNKGYIRVVRLREYVDALIKQCQDSGLDSVLTDNAPDATGEIDRLTDEKQSIESQIKTLIRKQATAPESVSDMYDEEIDRLSQRLQAISRRRAELRQEFNRRRINAGQRRAFDDIVVLGDNLWAQPEAHINQLLHRLLGHKRLVLDNGQIVGIGTRM